VLNRGGSPAYALRRFISSEASAAKGPKISTEVYYACRFITSNPSVRKLLFWQSWANYFGTEGVVYYFSIGI
jgi:hypothetical protein